MNRTIALVAMTMIFGSAHAQKVSLSKEWTDTFQVSSDPSLRIENIWGDITVMPGKAGEVVIHISERRSAPDEDSFEKSLEVLPLNIQATPDQVVLEVGVRNRSWHHRDPCRGCRVDYNFKVTVPAGTSLEVSTVNDGAIQIQGIEGLVTARNVNGPVNIADATDCEFVESVNGRVDVVFSRPPGRDCELETINGDINLGLPKGAGLDVAMDVFNGKMVSELPIDPLALPATVEESHADGRYQYRLKQAAGIRLAGGGPTFTISSMNGDIRIQNK